MNLTGEQLSEIETMAGLFFSPKEIGIVLELDLHKIDDFEMIIETNRNHPAFIAYHKGRLTTEVELRTAIKQAALNGSNPAQNTMLDFRQETQ